MSEILASPVFVIGTVLLMVIALLFVLLPLIRRDPAASKLTRRRKALEELRDDLEPADYRERMDKLDREAAEAGGGHDSLRGLVGLLVVSVPLLTLFLYTQIGRPDGIAPQAGENAELRQMLGELTSRVRAQPEDISAWNRLGMIWKQMQQYPAAEAAFRRVIFIDTENAFARVELAETLLYASGRGEMPRASEELLEEALAIDPENQKALWLSGLAAFHEGEPQRALAFWTRLRDLLPAGDVRSQINEQIARVSGGPGPASLADAPGQRINSRADSPPAVEAQSPARQASQEPSSEPRPAAREQPAAEGASIGVTVSLDPALADRVTGNETVFVFARAVNGPPAPLAVKRLTAADLPVRISLSDRDSMAQGLSLSAFPRVRVSARVSRSGNAIAATGDLEGQSGPISVETTGEVNILIDQVVD